MGIDVRRIPDNYLCELCSPRPLKNTVIRAKQIQEKKLAKWNRDNERRRCIRENRKRKAANSIDNHSQQSKKKKKNTDATDGSNSSAVSYEEIDANEYTESTKRLLDFVENTNDDDDEKILLRQQLKSSPSCQIMFVAPATQGIVATVAIAPNEFVAEYCGCVCLKAEIGARDKIGRQTAHCLTYK